MASTGRCMKIFRSERGAALPMAVLGLVVMAILTTTVLLSSSTEVTLSGAHQDGTRALYTAEGGIESYVAEFGLEFGVLTTANGVVVNPSYVPSGAGPGSAVRITLAKLGEVGDTAMYAVASQPVSGGGRSLVAFVNVLTTVGGDTLAVNVESAVTVGNTIEIIEGALISGIQKSQCEVEADTVSVGAILYTSDADRPQEIKDSQIECKASPSGAEGEDLCVEQAGYTQEELLYKTLGITSFDHLAARATKKYGDGTQHGWGTGGLVLFSFGPEAIDSVATDTTVTCLRWQGGGNNRRCTEWSEPHYTWEYTYVDVVRDSTHSHNIGCPLTTQPLNPDGTTKDGLFKQSDCTSDNANYWPVVDINATTRRDVKLYGHGQGMLIIRGGNVEVGPDFKFKGIIVSEGRISMDQRAVIVGAVLSKGDATVGNPDAKSEIDKVTMQFDRCAVLAAKAAFDNSPEGAETILNVNRTTSWFELVR